MGHNYRKKTKITTPYCYFIGWPELDRFYYGVKFAEGCSPDTFWQNYHTSSELVAKYRIEHGEPTLIQIRKVFDPIQYNSLEDAQRAAVCHEYVVIKRLKMVPDERFLNCHNHKNHRFGESIINHTKFRKEKFNGNYHSEKGTESNRAFNKVYSKLYNSMHKPEVKAKHLDSIAQKIGYKNHIEYVNTIKAEFEKYKTIKVTSDETGHSQYAIRHLLLDNFGKDWLESIRKEGIEKAKIKSANSSRSRPKIPSGKELNNNAYVWRAISISKEVHMIFGNRLEFCDLHNISHSLDPTKSHLRKGWEFEKICKIKDFTQFQNVV